MLTRLDKAENLKLLRVIFSNRVFYVTLACKREVASEQYRS